MSDLDKYFEDNNILYARYSDDIIVFADSEEELEVYKNYINKVLLEKDLMVNKEKEYVFGKNESWNFLGVEYNGGKVYLLKVTIDKIKGKKFSGKVLIATLIILELCLFSGCIKSVDCDVDGGHAHLYKDNESFSMYVLGEKEKASFNWDLERTEDYIMVDQEQQEIIDFENEEELYRIDLNQDAIEDITSTQEDYKEYRYAYTWLQPVVIYNGKTTTTILVPHTGYSWSKNPQNRNLTGEERVVHHVYYGYKVVTTANGELETIKSEAFDSIE